MLVNGKPKSNMCVGNTLPHLTLSASRDSVSVSLASADFHARCRRDLPEALAGESDAEDFGEPNRYSLGNSMALDQSYQHKSI